MSGRELRRWGLCAIGACITALYLFPIYWMYASSLKSPAELFQSPPTLFPAAIDLAAYAWIFTRENVPRYLANSFLLAGATTAATLLLAIPCAYAMSRLRSRWVDGALLGVMLAQVLPPALMATPIFIMFRQLGLTNSYEGVILALVTKSLPFAIVVLRPAFLQVPGELEEAARVDGCTRLSALFRVILPAARTAIVVCAILVFLMTYGEYVYAASLLSRVAMQPATVGLYAFIGAEISDWNNIMAFASAFVTPVIILFILMQRLIVQGMTAGAIK
jgi:multiple sugar transport system permease protein